MLRAAGLRGNGSVTKRSFFTFIFHAESVPRGGGPRGGGPRPLPPGPRGGGPRLCRNQSVCTKSGRRDDSARRYRDFFPTLVFAVARPSEEVREAADPSGAARGVAGRAAVRPWCSTSLAAALYVAACARRLSSTTLRLGAPGGPLGQRRSGRLDRRHQGCPAAQPFAAKLGPRPATLLRRLYQVRSGSDNGVPRRTRRKT